MCCPGEDGISPPDGCEIPIHYVLLPIALALQNLPVLQVYYLNDMFCLSPILLTVSLCGMPGSGGVGTALVLAGAQ